MLLFLYIVAVLAIAGATAVAYRHARKDPRQRNLDTLPVIIAIGGVGVTLLVIAVQLTTQPKGELRLVIAAGVVCGGVITAVFAAWLNYRRYRVEESRQQVEREKADLEQYKHSLEKEKLQLEHEKNERENAKAADESLTRAVELLGNQDPRVRAGGLHALASLAAHRPDRAQEAVELICMYLRNVPADPVDTAVGEAQRVLLRVVMRANAATPPVNDLDVNLTGARLDGFVFDHVTVGSLTLANAQLAGATSLRGLQAGVDMDGAELAGDVWLHEATLPRLSATGTVFRGSLSMESSTVDLDLRFADCVVMGDADFSGAEFGTLTFNGARLHGTTSFRRTVLRLGGTFLHAHFARADFDQLVSHNRVVLDAAHFEDAIRLTPRTVSFVSLRQTTVGPNLESTDWFRQSPGWRVVGDAPRHLVEAWAR
jgi:uncharacterized protein YjbI with pentapeptide repeats